MKRCSERVDAALAMQCPPAPAVMTLGYMSISVLPEGWVLREAPWALRTRDSSGTSIRWFNIRMKFFGFWRLDRLL